MPTIEGYIGDKPSKRQTTPQTREEEKLNLGNYKSEQEPDKRGMKRREVSDMDDRLRR